MKSKSAVDSFFDADQWLELVGYAKARMIKRPYESALAGFIKLISEPTTKQIVKLMHA